MFKSILEKILAALSRRAVRRYEPIIIGVTGSVGKTSTREAIAAVLRRAFSVRTAEKNYNTEIGLPLSILGMPYYGKNPVGWAWGIFFVWLRLAFFHEKFPDISVLEYGIDRPGDMDTLLKIAKPQIAVLTRIGDVPVHVEFFSGPEAVAAEKAKLVSALSSDGIAVLNADDPVIMGMKALARGRVVTYGKSLHADVRVMNSAIVTKKDEVFGEVPIGIRFKIQCAGKTTEAFIPRAIGASQLSAAGAAAAVGIIMRMEMADIVAALERFEPPRGRLRLLEGIKQTLIIDDTYNASPASVEEALEVLRVLRAKRKIAVLGDMLEIGRFSEDAHRAIGRAAADFVDILFVVGPNARFIGEEARAVRVQRRGAEKIFSFTNAISAGKSLQALLRPGDLVLVKGSQGMRMEMIVEEILAFSELAKELLVRQEDYWKRT